MMDAPATARFKSVYQRFKSAEYNVYSQNGEDGVIDAIFSEIEPSNKWCLEVGASDGILFSNTRRLIEDGWMGVLIESDPKLFDRLTESTRGHAVHLVNAKVGTDPNLDKILAAVEAPTDIDLVSIDVDGQDFHVWNQLHKYRPKVVVIEYNHTIGEDEFIPTIGGDGQACFRSILALGAGKRYEPVWLGVTNLVFVDREVIGDGKTLELL